MRTAGAIVTANTSDPVVWWQPSLLWSPPDLSRARRDAPVPRWLPVVSFVQATLDLPVALDAAPGHGHRYGPDQARCDHPDRDGAPGLGRTQATIGPRAASNAAPTR
ncbi:alpha/beta-hydrolase family protein [Rhodococcus aetherivorans]